jgi:hypothetical protein
MSVSEREDLVARLAVVPLARKLIRVVTGNWLLTGRTVGILLFVPIDPVLEPQAIVLG